MTAYCVTEAGVRAWAESSTDDEVENLIMKWAEEPQAMVPVVLGLVLQERRDA